MIRNVSSLLVVFRLVLMARQVSLAQDNIPFVPSPMHVVQKMIEVAEIKKGDILYDMGSGDGRIVIEAATRHGLRLIDRKQETDWVALIMGNSE